MQDLTKMCPEWQSSSEKLCENTSEMHELRQALLGNPQYAKIGPMCSKCDQDVKRVNSIRHLLDCMSIIRLEKSVAAGQATVCITFALYILYVKAPREPLMTARQTLLKDLKQELAKKGHHLNGAMLARMDELLKPAA